MARTTEENLKGYLDNEIRMRYSEESILPYDDNKAVHKFFKDNQIPSNEAKNMSIMNENITRMSYVLVKNIEAKTSGNPVSFDNPLTQHLLDELDIRPTREDLQKIKDRNLKMCVVGYGGAMINMLYNMHIWAMELGETKLFEKVVIFEKDDLDFTNILRIGKPVVFDYSPDFIRKYDSEVPNIKTLKKISMASVEKELSSERKLILFVNWLDNKAAEFLHKKDYFFVGAPTLETRQMLSDKKFFFLGHSDYEVDITYSPQAISSLAVETYGSIDIPVLLINLQLATAAFIKILAAGEEHQLDQRLLDFDMKKWIDENPKKLKELFNV
jgi:hypothetical protein